jgi:MerR family mercuric resistance operon transcriptional regulator
VSSSKHDLRIGSVAHATGVTVETVRYYERRGLLPKAARTRGRQRRYAESVISRLQLIQHAKTLGLSLDDIAEVLKEGAAGRPCLAMHATLKRHLERVDDEIATLQMLRETLARHLRACVDALAAQRGACPTLSAMERGRAAQSRHPGDDER